MQDDFGNPVNYTLRGLNEATSLLLQRAVPVTDDTELSSFGGLAEKVIQLREMRDQLSVNDRKIVEQQLPKALKFALTAEPSRDLPSGDSAVIKANLVRMRKIIQTKLDQLERSGHVTTL